MERNKRTVAVLRIFVPGTVIRQVEAEMLRQHNEAREPFVLKLYGLRGALFVMYALLFICWGQKKRTGWGKTRSEGFPQSKGRLKEHTTHLLKYPPRRTWTWRAQG